MYWPVATCSATTVVENVRPVTVIIDVAMVCSTVWAVSAEPVTTRPEDGALVDHLDASERFGGDQREHDRDGRDEPQRRSQRPS